MLVQEVYLSLVANVWTNSHISFCSVGVQFTIVQLTLKYSTQSTIYCNVVTDLYCCDMTRKVRAPKPLGARGAPHMYRLASVFIWVKCVSDVPADPKTCYWPILIFPIYPISGREDRKLIIEHIFVLLNNNKAIFLFVLLLSYIHGICVSCLVI
jgi:hypothetical protein